MIELLQNNGVINEQGFAGDFYNTAVYLKRLFPAISIVIQAPKECPIIIGL